MKGHSPTPWTLATGACNTVAGLLGSDGAPVAMLGNVIRLNPVDVAILMEAGEMFDLINDAVNDRLAPAADGNWMERAEELLARVYEFDLPS